MATRVGIVALVQLVKHICRILTSYRPAIDAFVNAAVGSGLITSVQRDILFTWLSGAQTACDILKVVTGY